MQEQPVAVNVRNQQTVHLAHIAVVFVLGLRDMRDPNRIPLREQHCLDGRVIVPGAIEVLTHPLNPMLQALQRAVLGSGPCNGHFQSAAAAVTLPGVPLIDFSPLAAGTSAGRIDFNVTGGSYAFDGTGTVSIGHLVTTSTGPSWTSEARGTASPLELVSPSCR